MSGIVGIITAGPAIERTLLDRMTDFLSFRGPDGRAVWCDGSIGFGQAFLNASRAAAAEQPPFTLDCKTFVVADARIDGRADLVRELREHGVPGDATASAAELILQAYGVWGEACVAHLLGDFAFAIWDRQREQLFCARDHFGVKPFFYAALEDGFVFGNTLSCLRLHPEVSAALNDHAIGDYLLFGFNQDLATTSFADIRRLPPAHSLTWSRGVVRTRRYWSLPTDGAIRYPDPQDYVEHFRDLLSAAVADRLPNGPVGISMSGGLDSTSLAAMACQQLLCGGRRRNELRAFTAVYDPLIPDEERQWSTAASTALGLPIQHFPANVLIPFADDGAGDGAGATSFPEPNDNPFQAVASGFLRTAARHAQVMLSGLGGDAVLYSSPAYMMNLLKRFRWGRWLVELTGYLHAHHRLPPLGLRSSLKRCLGLGPVAPTFPEWLNRDFADRFQLRTRWQESLGEAPPVHATHAEAYRLLTAPYWPWLFEQGDPGTTSIALEATYPFFDVRVVNFTLAIPPLPWCADKWILRAAMRDRLPDAIRLRPKKPLNGDLLEALSQQNAVRWLDHLEDMRPIAPYIDKEMLRQLATAKHLDPALTRPIGLLNWLKRLASCNSFLEVHP